MINLNQRVYDKEAGEMMVASAKLKEGRLYGELGYPDKFDTTLGNVSHTISNVRMVEDLIIGDIQVLDTTSGKLLNECLSEMVFRPRMVGILDEDGHVKITKFGTFDANTIAEDSYQGII